MSKELVVKTKFAVPTMVQENRCGFEDPAIMKQIIISRVKLLQALSPELTSGEYEGLKAGMIINSITKKPLPTKFVPLFSTVTYVRWNAEKAGDYGWDSNFGPEDIIYQTDNANDERLIEDLKFGPKKEPPACTEFINFLCLFEGLKMPMMLSFSRSMHKLGQELVTDLFCYKDLDMFSYCFDLSSRQETKNNKTWFVFRYKDAGQLDDSGLGVAKKMYENFFKAKKEFKVDSEEIVLEK